MPLTTFSAGPSSQPQKALPAQKAQLPEDYGKLPLSFEANRGQTDARVKFVARGNGYELYLTADGAVLTFGQGSAAHDMVRMQLLGASARSNGNAEPMGEEQLQGAVNYFIGNDAAKWHTGLPTFAKVRYTDIYPGIDLVYYGNQRQLEYDFVVAPGADPKPVRLQFGGAKELHLATDGNLVVTAASGTLAFHKPQVYQVVDGRRQPVAGEFALAKDSVGFRLGTYDHAKALVIDPVLVYSTYLGGSSADVGYAITVDAAGDAYVAGAANSLDFPVTPGALQTTSKGATNQNATGFVTKLNPAGTALLYSTYLGGSDAKTGQGDGIIGVAVDSLGNAYVTGYAYSTNFPVTAGAFQTTNKSAAGGGDSAFVTKLNPTGTSLVYSTYLGGSGVTDSYGAFNGDMGIALVVDGTGNAYVTGQAVSADFPVTQGAFQTTNKGAAQIVSNVFVAKLNPSGTALVYSTYLGGSGTKGCGEYVDGSAVDSGGNAYLTGATCSTDFPVTQGAFQTTNHYVPINGYAETTAFVSKLNPAGSALVYSTYLGGSNGNGDSASGVAVDDSGNAYVAGIATSTDFPVTSGAFQMTNNGSAHTTGNAFVSKLNPTGTALVYSTYLGGSGGPINLSPTLGMLGGDQASNIAVDSFGDAYVAGTTASANFPVTAGAYQTTNNDQSAQSIGGYNLFVTKLNPAGSSLLYSTFLGGSGINPYDEVGVIGFGEGEQANALALDGSGNVYVTGVAGSGDFPVTQGAIQTAIRSRGNAFVVKLNPVAASTATAPTVTVTANQTEVTSAVPLPLAVTISVSAASGNPTPTGTVTLANGAYSSGGTTLNGGSATINIPAASLYPSGACYPASANILTANYLPDAASSAVYKFASGVSSVYDVAPCITVTPAATTLTWVQAQSQLSVTIVASSYIGQPLPTGSVMLTTGSYTSAPVTLSSTGTTITLPAKTLTTGFNTLTANYAGDSNYAPYTGAGLVTVGGVTVTVIPSASTITTTQSLSVTITVSSGSGSPSPTGMVTLVSGSYLSATTPLTGGSATITIPAGALAAGVDMLGVSYGAGNFAGASGSASVTVTGPSWGFAIGGTPVSIARGVTSGNTSTITVTPSNGFTGVVVLSAAITSSPAGAQDLPTMSFGSTGSVGITGAAATATLTISTTAASSAAIGPLHRAMPWYVAGDAALACMLFFGWPARRRGWRRSYGGLLGLVALLALVAGGLSACAGGSSGNGGNTNPGTTPGTYIVMVSGRTSGTTAGQGTITLTVQ